MRQLSSRSTDHLTKDTFDAAAAMSVIAELDGLDILICSTYRDPWEQARLFRQSRPLVEIERTAYRLRRGSNPEMADVLMEVGPRYGRHVTNAAPGESWHQWGRALDAVPWLDSKTLAWSADSSNDAQYERARNLWMIYGNAVRQAGMVWGGDWIQGDRPHCQIMETRSNPLWVLSDKTKADWAERMGWND